MAEALRRLLPRDRDRLLHAAALLLLLAHGARVSYKVATNPGLQGDLRIYRSAALASADGDDPYRTEALKSATGKPVRLPFVYPPATLPLLRVLLLVDEAALPFVFFGIKLVAVAALVVAWQRSFFPEPAARAVLLLLCAVGYHQSLKMDLRAGNVSVFEQLVLWLGAIAFLRGRTAVFAALVAAAAFFKVTFAALLLLALLDGRRGLRAAVAALTFLATVHGTSWVVRPDLFEGFWRNAAALDDRGAINPSSLAILRDALGVTPGDTASGRGPERVAYTLLAIALAGGTVWAVRRRRLGEDRIHAIWIALFLYALLVPRFKDYSYILLIPPSTYVVTRVLADPVLKGFALFAVCTHFFAYQSWFAALLLYVLYLASLRRPAAAAP